MKNFYTFEGTDGSGKTTLSKAVVDVLNKIGIDAIYTREPGGTNIFTSERIRELILSDSMESIEPKTEFLLYLASRNEHIEKFIAPRVGDNYVVICDRYNDSSLAYQGYAKSDNTEEFIKISNSIISNAIPFQTFFIDIDPKFGVNRIRENRKNEVNRFDNMNYEFHQKVYDGYKKLIKNEPKRFTVLDGNDSFENNINKVVERISNDVLDSKIKKNLNIEKIISEYLKKHKIGVSN